MRTYKIWKNGEIVELPYPGQYAGITTQRVFGLPHCCGGKRAKPENRIWFFFYEDAIQAGYRPCKICKPDKSYRFLRAKCSHMPFGLTGGMSLSVTKLRVRYRVQCSMCDEVLGHARQDEEGHICWHDGFIIPHEEMPDIDEISA